MHGLNKEKELRHRLGRTFDIQLFANDGGFEILLISRQIKGASIKVFATCVPSPAESATSSQHVSILQFNITVAPGIGVRLVRLQALEVKLRLYIPYCAGYGSFFTAHDRWIYTPHLHGESFSHPFRDDRSIHKAKH